MSELVPREKKIETVRAELMKPAMLEQLRMALPKHVTPERLARIVLTEIRRTPKLAECTRESLFGSIMTVAQLGLEPGVLGQAWLIPFENRKMGTIECQLIIGYRGMASLAWRSAQVKSIEAHVVYEGDAFEWSFGLAPKLFYKPSGKEIDPDKITHAYAVIRTSAGGELFDVMNRAEIDAVRRRSRAKDSGPWVTDYSEMAKKTVLRRLFKLAPASVEMQRALDNEERFERGEPQAFAPEIDVTPPHADTKPKTEEGEEIDPETGEVIPAEVGRPAASTERSA